MRSRTATALALAIAGMYCAGAIGEPASKETTEERDVQSLPALGAGISAAALIAAGVAAAAALAGRGSGGDSGAQASGASGEASSQSSRTLLYSSPADFRTSEFLAQRGLQAVKADRLYYNGHYRWYVGEAPHPAAGTGAGVKIAVADTGINPQKGSTGAAIAIDVGSSYDYVRDRPGSAGDVYGHGTHVAGIIAAPRTGTGMHGLAYNATLVNFKVGNELITATDAQLADMLGRAAASGAMIINNSWATPSPITLYSAGDLHASMPRMIEAARRYVAANGVVVFAAGNDANAQPSLQAGLPYRITGLEPGWLAVVAVDPSGRLASYSNRCGVAATWCLAAPGGSANSGLYSMHNNGDYVHMAGTSMAAPHAAAALAALKSMFPNLSTLQIRDRLLYTANRSGPYADASAYGQGLMDLDAASSPVDGVAIPVGSSAAGPTAAVAGSGIQFQRGALSSLGMQPWVLVVDNYQRAPFWVPAQTFFQETAPRLIERQWASLRSAPRSSARRSASPLQISHSPDLNTVVSADLSTYRLGFSKGAGGETILGSHLELAWLPRLAASGVDSVALGYASDFRGIRVGLLGSVPASPSINEHTLEPSTLGGRKALGLVAQQRVPGTTYGISFAVAEDFERPIGIATSGAFGFDKSAAVSSGIFAQQSIGRATVLEASFEVAHHRAMANGALDTPAYALRAASLESRTRLAPGTSLSASLKHEWSGRDAVRVHVPLSIDEKGDIGRVTYALPYDDLLGRTALTLRLDHALTRNAYVRGSVTHERLGFGASVTGVAAILEIVN